MYHKPNTVINILLRIRQPKVRIRASDSKPITFLETPEDFALFAVMKNCLTEAITKKVGYEAGLANVGYEIEIVEEMAIRIWISGYSQKLFNFAEILIDTMLECAKQGGFEHSQVMNSIEMKKSEYANNNTICTEYATHNRLLFLFPHTFNDSLMN